MRLTATINATETVAGSDDEKELALELACEAFEDEPLELKIEDKTYVLDANELMEAVCRIAVESLTDKKKESE